MERLQGELFDEAEDQPVMAHLLGRKNKATASGGGHFTCWAARYHSYTSVFLERTLNRPLAK